MDSQITTAATARAPFRSEAWEAWAACRGAPAGLFYRDVVFVEDADAQHEREDRAKTICATCFVRAECLEYALRVDEQLGVWGGRTSAERRRANGVA